MARSVILLRIYKSVGVGGHQGEHGDLVLVITR